MSNVEIAGYPRGWFGIGFSNELAVGAVKPMRYFGQDLVAFRGEDGAVRVLDAHCPHLGAHMGYGGSVVGNCLQCPFHAWRFGAEGRCVEIPYAKKIPPGAHVRSWPIVERNSHIFIWHDRDGGPPDFEVPTIAEYGTDEWLPWSTYTYPIKTHPREIVDNLADKAHFGPIHRTRMEGFGFQVDGQTATQWVKGVAYQGEKIIDRFESTTTYHGPGILIMRMVGYFENYLMFVHTPIDEEHLDLRMGISLRITGTREATEGALKMYLENVRSGFEDDVQIWERKVYRDLPVLCDGDGPLGRMRRWYRQFYTSPTAAPQGEAP